MHFTTGNDNMYRIEYDIASHRAEFALNNIEATSSTAALFDRFFPSCVPAFR